MKRLIFILSVGAAILFGPASAAIAVSPECDIVPPPPPALIDAQSGTISFCTSRVDDDGDTFPDAGYPQTCYVNVDGQDLQVVTGAEPGQYVIASVPGFKYEHDIAISCENSVGRGTALVSRGRFPPAIPGRPFVPGV